MRFVNECTNDSNRYNVIIIGAGLSGMCKLFFSLIKFSINWLIDWLIGLYAANILNDYGITDYCVLEARDRIGGRLLTKQDEKVGWVDLGGSYVGPSQHYIQKLIKKLDIKTYKIDVQGKSVYMNQVNKIVY